MSFSYSGCSIPDRTTNFLTKFAPLVYAIYQSFRFSPRRANIRGTEPMNKLKLIQALRDATELTKPEAEKVVKVFFNDMAAALAKGVGWRSVDCARFSSRNAGLTSGGIRKQDSGSRLNRSVCRFLSPGRN